MHTLDHLLWEEFSLEAGEKRFATLTGVTPSYGGSHPGGGTHNSLVSLGEDIYLELIAADPNQADVSAFAKEPPPNFSSGLFTFGVKADDLDHVEHLVAQAGLSVASVHDVVRQSPQGDVLAWKTLVVGGHGFKTLIPFFTRFEGTTHPAESSPKGCELLEFSLGHPDSEDLARLYTLLQVDVPVFTSEMPQLRAVLMTPKGKVVLTKSRSG